MCGICVSLWTAGDLTSPSESMFERIRAQNVARGPDAQNVLRTILPLQARTTPSVGSRELILDCFASELQLRGNAKVIQPHCGDEAILCWNGEESGHCRSIPGSIFDGPEILHHENDGVKLFKDLCEISSAEDVSILLGQIEGPYALTFYHAKTQSLYFARDPLGRRSLLIHRPTSIQPYFVLSSVSDGSDHFSFEEVGTGWIFCLRLSELILGVDITSTFDTCVHRFARNPVSLHPGLPYATLSKVNMDIPEEAVMGPVSLDTVPDYLWGSVDRLIVELDKSVQLQVKSIPQPSSLGQVRVAILFSGGIDSAALCFFADRHVPQDEPIDLLNVAFENPHKIRVHKEGMLLKRPGLEREKRTGKEVQCDASYMVPDRISGWEELEELRRVCPGRVWNFIEINVPYKETQEARLLVESIMFPSRTVMDLSLALALWFASRGVGSIKSQPGSEPVPYTSTARVLLNGLGSDELLGGYGRHRSVFTSGGWRAVAEELQLDLDRIPVRNLGRDDRIISSHGKESRHPFLSLDLVSFLVALPVHHKIDPRLKAGVGDKLLLRLAMKKVGMELASARKKRAMQFGTRSARMEGERRGDVPLE